jgi:hypothetical protein
VLYRIQAVRDIPMYGIRAGDKGGFVESENNLSHADSAWVADDARINGDAWVSGYTWVSGDAPSQKPGPQP